MLPWTPASAWDRGDTCIVSHGDAIADSLCYDHATQLETSAEFLWDGNHDFPPYEEEVEVDTIVICEGCGLDDTKELELEHCNVEVEVDTGFICEGCGSDDAKEFEVESCHDAELEDSAVADAKEFGMDFNSEDYYSLCFGAEEACCFDAEEEDWDYGNAEDYVEACFSY